MKRPVTLSAVAVLAASFTAAPAGAAPAPDAAASRKVPVIRMSGQQITQAIVADLAYFYRHQVKRPPRFELTPGGTTGGLADLARGITDAAMVSRELGPQDPPGLRLRRLAFSGVCLASHHTNPVPGMTRALVRDIVGGRVSSWSQVPGSTRSDLIAPVALDPGTGAHTVFEQVFLDPADPVAWQPVTLLLSIQARDYLEATPAAFAYLDLAATGPVHAIPYEWHPCTRATVRDGSYPARRPLGIATKARPKPALRKFLRWIRTSRTARRVLNRRYVAAPS
jgi:ABC-type phosphate transport system substrate-binding protein